MNYTDLKWRQLFHREDLSSWLWPQSKDHRWDPCQHTESLSFYKTDPYQWAGTGVEMYIPCHHFCFLRDFGNHESRDRAKNTQFNSRKTYFKMNPTATNQCSIRFHVTKILKEKLFLIILSAWILMNTILWASKVLLKFWRLFLQFFLVFLNRVHQAEVWCYLRITVILWAPSIPLC